MCACTRGGLKTSITPERVSRGDGERRVRDASGGEVWPGRNRPGARPIGTRHPTGSMKLVLQDAAAAAVASGGVAFTSS